MNDCPRVNMVSLHAVSKAKTLTKKKKVKKNKHLNKTVVNLVHIDNFTKLYDDNLTQFRNYLENSEYNRGMSAALNEYRENLLHLACQYNEPQHIKQLIELKCSIYKQDFYGRTPLHVAIQRDHRKCTEIFMQLLTELNKCNQFENKQKELIENLRKMFRVYNHDGYTVLHLAVLKNLSATVRIMLEFCIKFQINVLECEVLGSGDSILHLAVKNNLQDIKYIIIEQIKESVNFPNYSGAIPNKYCANDERRSEIECLEEEEENP